MINFTQDELELLKLEQLRRLCKYYDIEVFRSWNKHKLVQEILDYQKPPGYEPIAMSARIQRIYQSTHSKEE